MWKYFLIALISNSIVSCSKTNSLVIVEKTVNLGNKQNAADKLKAGYPIKIACEGTSLTYGEDINGTDTITSSLTGGPTRAITQYPAAMLKAINNPLISLSRRGYPGDRTTEGLIRWKDSTDADICIIEYGTNDVYNFAGYTSGQVDIATYKTQLKALVQRRINQGTWVILCLSPFLQNRDGAISAYRIAAKQLAKDFYIPVFDIQQSIDEVPNNYSDNVHLNSRSYQQWGVDIAAIIKGGLSR